MTRRTRLDKYLQRTRLAEWNGQETICQCRKWRGEYHYRPECWRALMNGEGVPCQQVKDCGIRPAEHYLEQT